MLVQLNVGYISDFTKFSQSYFDLETVRSLMYWSFLYRPQNCSTYTVHADFYNLNNILENGTTLGEQRQVLRGRFCIVEIH